MKTPTKKNPPAKRTSPARKPVPVKSPPSTTKPTPSPTTVQSDSTPPVAAATKAGQALKRGPAPKRGVSKSVEAEAVTVAAPVPGIGIEIWHGLSIDCFSWLFCFGIEERLAGKLYSLKEAKASQEAKVPDESTLTKPATVNPQAAASPRKVIRRVVKKKVVRARTSRGKAESTSVAQLGDDDKAKIEESQNEEPTNAEQKVDSEEKESSVPLQFPDKGKAKMDEVDVTESVNDEHVVEEVEKSAAEEEPLKEEPMEEEPVEEDPDEEEPIEEDTLEEVEHGVEQSNEPLDEVEPGMEKEGMDVESTEKPETETGAMNKDEEPEEMVEYGEDEEAFVEPGDEEFQDDDGLDTGDDTKASEVEHMELNAAEEEHKVRKEVEVFVGGLDHEVEEEDLRKAFEKVGDVVEVRLLKDPVTGKNRGFAFVRFATKEQANRALAEMMNPVIRGKRCGTAASEGNDTLFVGNICNTWTKEAIKQKLKDYSVEAIEHITLVQDPRHEGLSRGFCFIQFSCHADAMIAYKRLQKPDVILGHLERTAKVAFAEPLREPDPEVMSKVKSVFVDGLPPYWDEDRVREHFKSYGEIECITLARNMPTAKRKDFGFVDFTTHQAALACIQDVNSKELNDGKSKAKVKARLSNPSPKTQTVKGGMCGGFPIGRGGTYSMWGRGFPRGGRSYNQPFNYGRGFYKHDRSQFYDPVGSYSGYNERRPVGYGGRRSFRARSHVPFSDASPRSNYAGPRHGGFVRDLGRSVPSHRELPPVEDPYAGPAERGYDDPYLYDGTAHGMKRPLYMANQEPGYADQRGVRPRYDYTDPGREHSQRDNFGPGSSLPPSGYYGSDLCQILLGYGVFLFYGLAVWWWAIFILSWGILPRWRSLFWRRLLLLDGAGEEKPDHQQRHAAAGYCMRTVSSNHSHTLFIFLLPFLCLYQPLYHCCSIFRL
ncbi:Heterogeneous nuclear ribonucleoprotein Q-like protein [Drosera capensis]